MPRAGGCTRRRPVFWWNANIAEQRRSCLKARRAYTRKRKRADEAGSAVERDHFRKQRKILASKIAESKDKHWSDLCAQVDGDPWGKPYKIVMKKLVRRKPIPRLEIPGRLDAIVGTLFPRRPVTERITSAIGADELEQTKFTINELLTAARELPNGKAPGPDGIPNEVLKVAVKTHPGFFAKIFNSCIRQACFPADWKLARLVLLHKPGSPPNSPSAYRLLCMLNTVSKLFEKLITLRLREHLAKSGNLSEINMALGGEGQRLMHLPDCSR